MRTLAREIADEVKQHETRMENLVAKLKQTILDLPDNPKIIRLSRKCFIANSSDIFASGNWTPEHHDFKAQYRHIVDLIERAEPKNKIQVVKNAVNKGTIQVRGQYVEAPPFFRCNDTRYLIRLHENVRAYLAELVGMTKDEKGKWQ